VSAVRALARNAAAAKKLVEDGCLGMLVKLVSSPKLVEHRDEVRSAATWDSAWSLAHCAARNLLQARPPCCT
jgi:hypothetical protein